MIVAWLLVVDVARRIPAEITPITIPLEDPESTSLPVRR
jgi:hypothetical protein